MAFSVFSLDSPLVLKMLFPVTQPLQVFNPKNPYPNIFSSFPTPNHHKLCMEHAYFEKKIILTKITFCPSTYPIFIQTVTGNKEFNILGLNFLVCYMIDVSSYHWYIILKYIFTSRKRNFFFGITISSLQSPCPLILNLIIEMSSYLCYVLS